MEGFAAFGKALYHGIGCLPIRRYVGDINLVKNIKHIIGKKRVAVVFPEARRSNVGTNSPLGTNVGKLIRHLNVPVVVLKSMGSYLDAPIWNEKRRQKAPFHVQLEAVLTPTQIAKMTIEEMTAVVNEHFVYDEYKWQWEQKICIGQAFGAEGLHKMLYMCPACSGEHTMESDGSNLLCNACKKRWCMDEYGRLRAIGSDTEFTHVSDGYGYERGKIM